MQVQAEIVILRSCRPDSGHVEYVRVQVAAQLAARPDGVLDYCAPRVLPGPHGYSWEALGRIRQAQARYALSLAVQAVELP